MNNKKLVQVSATRLSRDISKYLELIENGYTIYIIKSSIIVAEMRPIDWGEIEKVEVKETK